MAEKKGLVRRAVEADLAALAKRDKALAEGALAASALTLAREMDDSGNSATSKSMCAKSLMETLDRLRTLAPAHEEKDGLDDLSAKRAARLAGGAAASDSARS